MARIHLLTDDLLFGSHLLADLERHGHTVSIGLEPAVDVGAFVLDLTADAPSRLDSLPPLRPPTLAFFSHVEHETRELAIRAGIEIVIPRSRVAREGPALIERLLATGS